MYLLLSYTEGRYLSVILIIHLKRIESCQELYHKTLQWLIFGSDSILISIHPTKSEKPKPKGILTLTIW